MTVEEFQAVCDRFTNKRLFERDHQGDLVRDAAGNLTQAQRRQRAGLTRMGGVAIIDYGLCNLDSVRRAGRGAAAASPYVVTDGRRRSGGPTASCCPASARSATRWRNLARAALDAALADAGRAAGMPAARHLPRDAAAGAPRATEGGRHRGPRVDPGRGPSGSMPTRERPASPPRRLERRSSPTGHAAAVRRASSPTADFYFVHSYHLVPDDPATCAATTPYADGLVSSVGPRRRLRRPVPPREEPARRLPAAAELPGASDDRC